MITQARLIIAGLLLAAILAGGTYIYLTRKALHTAQARVATAEQQASLNQQTGEITERVIRSEVTIRTQAERAADAIQTAPGADTPLDPDFRDKLCAAVDSLRDGSPACDDQPAAATP